MNDPSSALRRDVRAWSIALSALVEGLAGHPYGEHYAIEPVEDCLAAFLAWADHPSPESYEEACDLAAECFDYVQAIREGDADSEFLAARQAVLESLIEEDLELDPAQWARRAELARAACEFSGTTPDNAWEQPLEARTRERVLAAFRG